MALSVGIAQIQLGRSLTETGEREREKSALFRMEYECLLCSIQCILFLNSTGNRAQHAVILEFFIKIINFCIT